jgi:hypothetical protein
MSNSPLSLDFFLRDDYETKVSHKLLQKCTDREQFDSGVTDVIISSDHAQVQRRQLQENVSERGNSEGHLRDLSFVVDLNAFGLLQIIQRVLHQLG